jgi:predicted nucleic acid-binding protein
MADPARPGGRSSGISDGAAIVLDASAMVDLLLDTEASAAIRSAVSGHPLAVPAHFDAEILSAIGRLQAAGGCSAPA